MENTTGVFNTSVTISDNVFSVAYGLLNFFQDKYRRDMDEMKFHKLMYFAQRESFIQSNRPLFDATFYGWKYGPILKEIRDIYSEYTEGSLQEVEISDYAKEILQITLQHYGEMDSWELCSLSRGEQSWSNSRLCVDMNENSDKPINIEDIAKDAERVKKIRNSTNPVIFM